MSGEYWVGRESVSNMMQYLRTLVQSSRDEAQQKTFRLTHLSNIFDKLGISTRLELALFAVNHSLPLRKIGEE